LPGLQENPCKKETKIQEKRTLSKGIALQLRVCHGKDNKEAEIVGDEFYIEDPENHTI